MKYNNFLILAVVLVFLTIIITQRNYRDSSEYIFHNLAGDLIDFNDYKGKYSILTFTFTSCPSICPMINYELNKLQFKYQNKINIISINVDPENDTPQNLKNFTLTNQYEWDHLVGDRIQIENVMGNLLHSDKKLETPGHHLPNLHLMNMDFKYIEGFFPVEENVNDLMDKLDSLLTLDNTITL